MKKFTFLIVALLVAAMGFAQTKQLAKPTFKAKTTVATRNTRAVTGTLQLCGDMSEDNAIGTGGAGTLSAATRFEADDLTAYVGQYITNISVGVADASVISSARVAILTGTVDAPSIVLQQACTFTNGINNIELDVPYQIPASTAIMIAYEMVVTGGHPMGVDAGPAVANGDLLCIGALGTGLVSMNEEYDLDYNNIITATVEDEVASDPMMVVNPTAMSFSGFVGDANTPSKAATLVAVALTADINITTAAPFEVSADNTTFGTSATMTGAGTFYVRYIPANAEVLNVTGTVTIASTGAESKTIALTANTYDCANVITIPYEENFTNMSGCWTMVSNNPENETGTYGYGPYDLNGEMVFRFSSYEEAVNEDYNQFLITPELSLPDGAVLSFDYAGEDEEFRVMVSETNNDIASFTALGDDMIAESDEFANYIAIVPAGTKYIAINYFSDYMYFLFVDNFSLTEIPATPEIALTSVTPTTGTTVISGENINISGVVANNGAALTSYKVAYTVDGGTPVEYTVSEINVALGETHNFTHTTPVVLETAGQHTIEVTISEPNGEADGDDSDNSQTITLNVITCDPITELPYTQTFDELTECWGVISNNEANAGRMGIYDLEGENVFRFSSYSSADDYNQYLITPKLGYTNSVKLSFNYAKSNSSNEVFKILVSSTDNNIASFTALSEEVTVTSTEMTPYEIIIPAGTKYVAINYYSDFKYYMYVDNLMFSELAANEIELVNVSLSEESGCGLNTVTATATVKNNGLENITSFTLSYAVNDGDVTEVTVTPENPIASGETYEYTTEAINISELGAYNIEVIISLEGDADDTNNDAEASISNLAPQTIPYENELDAEEDVLGFHFIDADADDNTWALDEDEGALYIESSEANDYAITSCITVEEAGDYVFDFDYAGGLYDDTYASWGYIFDYKENFQIVYGTAPTAEAMTNVIATYTDVYEENLVNARRGFSIAAAGTYYFGILCNSTEGDHLYIDNISIYPVPTTSEIALTSVAPANGSTVQTGQNINISGVVTNNGVALTSYKVVYTVDNGEAVEYDVTGINVALGETHNFTHATPVVLETAGEHTIVVTVSNPNGSEDGDASDNSMTITINAISCDPITTFPYTEDFENGIPQCWTLIDADDDGFNWTLGTSPSTMTHNESANSLYSESYSNDLEEALNPDNWAITPAITLPEGQPASISFFAGAQDASWAAEHYGVYVSTTTIDPSAFTCVFEETMNANGGRTPGEWGEKQIDLSSYAGQTIYVAFRHFNCTDNFFLVIDDITVALVSAAEENIAEAIEVYPNPTSSMVTIANAEGKDIIVVNSLGQVVASIENAAANQTIDVSNFANGTYFVKVDAEVVKLNVVK